MSKEVVKILKDKIKEVNPKFQDGALISDAAFSQIQSIPPQQIEFGCRVNSAQGLFIGLKDRFVFVEKGVFITLSTTSQDVKYEDITDITIKEKFISDKIILAIGRKELIFDIDKKESKCIVEFIKGKMNTLDTHGRKRSVDEDFSLSFNVGDISFDIIGRNFENDFKLFSGKNELYFQKIYNHEKEKIHIIGNIKNIMQVTEENKNSLLKKAGWGLLGGAVGGLVAAPVALAGFFAGIVAKGKKKEICFACELKTGEKFLAKTDNETFQKLLAVSMI